LKGSAPIVFIELHNEIVTKNGGDPNAALDELAALGYVVLDLEGEPITSEVIFKKAITRVIAKSRK